MKKQEKEGKKLVVNVREKQMVRFLWMMQQVPGHGSNMILLPPDGVGEDCCQEDPQLPFPTRMIQDPVHGEIEEYLIPPEHKEDLFARLYPFDPIPSLQEQRYDLHSEAIFTIRDYRVVRLNQMNWLVSPFFDQSGGTMLDWLPMESLAEFDGTQTSIDQE